MRYLLYPAMFATSLVTGCADSGSDYQPNEGAQDCTSIRSSDDPNDFIWQANVTRLSVSTALTNNLPTWFLNKNLRKVEIEMLSGSQRSLEQYAISTLPEDSEGTKRITMNQRAAGGLSYEELSSTLKINIREEKNLGLERIVWSCDIDISRAWALQSYNSGTVGAQGPVPAAIAIPGDEIRCVNTATGNAENVLRGAAFAFTPSYTNPGRQIDPSIPKLEGDVACDSGSPYTYSYAVDLDGIYLGSLPGDSQTPTAKITVKAPQHAALELKDLKPLRTTVRTSSGRELETWKLSPQSTHLVTKQPDGQGGTVEVPFQYSSHLFQSGWSGDLEFDELLALTFDIMVNNEVVGYQCKVRSDLAAELYASSANEAFVAPLDAVLALTLPAHDGSSEGTLECAGEPKPFMYLQDGFKFEPLPIQLTVNATKKQLVFEWPAKMVSPN